MRFRKSKHWHADFPGDIVVLTRLNSGRACQKKIQNYDCIDFKYREVPYENELWFIKVTGRRIVPV